MYRSDKAVGMFYAEAIRFFEQNDLWAEVTDFLADAYGIVTKVLH